MHREYTAEMCVCFKNSEYLGGVLTSGVMEVFQIAGPTRIRPRSFEPRVLQPTKILESVLELFGHPKTSNGQALLSAVTLKDQHTHRYLLSLTYLAGLFFTYCVLTYIIICIQFRLSKNCQIAIFLREGRFASNVCI
jgi:hypothetical protein